MLRRAWQIVKVGDDKSPFFITTKDIIMKSTITFKNPKMKKAFETPGEWIGIVNQRTSIVKEDKLIKLKM